MFRSTLKLLGTNARTSTKVHRHGTYVSSSDCSYISACEREALQWTTNQSGRSRKSRLLYQCRNVVFLKSLRTKIRPRRKALPRARIDALPTQNPPRVWVSDGAIGARNCPRTQPVRVFVGARGYSWRFEARGLSSFGGAPLSERPTNCPRLVP